MGMLRGRDYGDTRDLTIADLMEPEEKKGMLRSLAEMGASGLAGAGWILDLPGALVRGTLAGDPLSAFGTFDERVDGRELMRDYGLLDEDAEDSWGNWTAGMVGEILLDPLTYIAPGASTFGKGAATKAMKALDASGATRFAKQYADELGVGVRELYRTKTADDFLNHMAGLKLPEGSAADLASKARETFEDQYLNRFGGSGNISEALRAPLAKDLSIGIPGTNINTAFDLPLVGGLPAKVGDKVAKFATENPYIGPTTTRLSALFNTGSGGFYLPGDLEGTLQGQKLARKKFRDETLAKEYLLGGEGQFYDKLARAQAGELLDDAGNALDPNSIEVQRAINDFVEDRAYFEAEKARNPYYRAIEQNEAYANLANYIKDLGPRLKRLTKQGGGDLKEFTSSNWTRTGNLNEDGSLAGLGYIARQSQMFNKQKLPDLVRRTPKAYARQSKIFNQGVKGRKPELDLPQWLLRKLTTEKKFGRTGDQYLQDVLAGYENFGDTRLKEAIKDIDAAYRTAMTDAFGKAPEVETLYGDYLDNFLQSESYLKKQARDAQDLADNRNDLLEVLTSPSLPDTFTTQDSALANALLAAQEADIERILKDPETFKLLTGKELRAGDRAKRALRSREKDVENFYGSMAERLRDADLQFKERGVGMFDSPLFENIAQRLQVAASDRASLNALYEVLRASKGEEFLPNVPRKSAPIGFVPFRAAAKTLGLGTDTKRMKSLLGKYTGKGKKKVQITPKRTAISKRLVDALNTLQPQTTIREPITGLGALYKQFTNAFKVGALANPAFLTRNLYSGLANNAALGAGNLRDFYLARGGGTGVLTGKSLKDGIVKRLKGTPGYRGLENKFAGQELNDEIYFKFAREAAAQDLLSGNVLSDISGVANQESRLLPGQQAQKNRESFVEGLKPSNFFGMRGVNLAGLFTGKGVPLRENTNPLLRMIDSGNEAVENTLRLGTFLNQARKGVAPGVAGDLSRMANVDYRPQAFTRFENDYIKQLVPFYSFQRGILPSIANNLVYRPGGVMGQSIRAVNRGSQPTEENFVPEYLRKSAAIPLPEEFGGVEGLQRYVTNIDLPWESTFDLLSQGGSISDTFGKTLANIAGQTNPLIKYGIESATGKQLYTGKNLRDTFSSLEKQFGPEYRKFENPIRNLLPFGSKIMSLFQGITDDRLTPQQRATKLLINNLAGLKISDVDPELARSRAARDMLNEILQGTPGTKVYENISVPEEALNTMTPEQQKLYLLYRTIQSEAQKKARERKKLEAQSLLNPLAGAR